MKKKQEKKLLIKIMKMDNQLKIDKSQCTHGKNVRNGALLYWRIFQFTIFLAKLLSQ